MTSTTSCSVFLQFYAFLAMQTCFSVPGDYAEAWSSSLGRQSLHILRALIQHAACFWPAVGTNFPPAGLANSAKFRLVLAAALAWLRLRCSGNDLWSDTTPPPVGLSCPVLGFCRVASVVDCISLLAFGEHLATVVNAFLNFDLLPPTPLQLPNPLTWNLYELLSIHLRQNMAFPVAVRVPVTGHIISQ